MFATRLQKVAASSIVTLSTVAAFAASGYPSTLFQRKTNPTLTKTTSSRRTHCSAVTDNSSSPFQPMATRILNERFQMGDSYTWLYRQKVDSAPSSWERYTVVDVNYPYFVVEMSTKFRQEEPYQTHHRMTINLEEQLSAVYSKNDRKFASFEYKDFVTGEWHTGGPGKNVQAFEEKFNVFVMTPSWQRVVMGMTAQDMPNGCKIARPLRHRYTQSWYGFQPEEVAGVALCKDFGEYTFALMEQTRNGVTTTFDVQEGV